MTVASYCSPGPVETTRPTLAWFLSINLPASKSLGGFTIAMAVDAIPPRMLLSSTPRRDALLQVATQTRRLLVHRSVDWVQGIKG
jgi:hypothetical protein